MTELEQITSAVEEAIRRAYLKLPSDVSDYLDKLSGPSGYMCVPVQLGYVTHNSADPVPRWYPPLLRAFLLANGGGIRLEIITPDSQILWSAVLLP